MFEDPHAEPPPPEPSSLGSVFGMFGPQTQTNQWHSATRILLVTFYHCHSFCYIFIMFVENKEWTLLFLLNRWKPSCQHDVYFDMYCVDQNSQRLVQIYKIYFVKTRWDVSGINKLCRDLDHIKTVQDYTTYIYTVKYMTRVYIHVHALFCRIGQFDLRVRCTCILHTWSIFFINEVDPSQTSSTVFISPISLFRMYRSEYKCALNYVTGKSTQINRFYL